MSIVIKTCGILMESTNRPMEQKAQKQTQYIWELVYDRGSISNQ